MDSKAPRVNGEYLSQHRAHKVTIIGQVLDKESSPLTIRTTDSKVVAIHKNSMLHPNRFDAAWIEVTGKVAADNSIEEESTVPIRSTIDTEAWNSLVKL